MKVYSIVFGNTRYLALQVALWRAHCTTMTEFVVVNNGPDHAAIDRAAYWLDVRTIRVPEAPEGWYGTEGTKNSPSHAWAIDSTLQSEPSALSKEGVLFIDCDLFPFREVKPSDAAVGAWWKRSGGIHFPWAGMLWLGPMLPHRDKLSARTVRNIPREEFAALAPDGLDTGAGVLWHLSKYMPKQNENGINLTTEHWPSRALSKEDLPNPTERDTVTINLARHFQMHVVRDCCLHTVCGTNWRNFPRHEWQRKEQAIQQLLWRFVRAIPERPDQLLADSPAEETVSAALSEADLTDRDTLIAALPHGGRVVEVGAQRGGFAQHILELNQPAALYLVDCWQRQPEEVYGHDRGTNNQDHEANLKFVRQRFGDNPAVSIIQALSVDAAKQFEDGSLDIVYIDANHFRVAEDIEAWWPKLKQHGWLCGHDYTTNAWIHVKQPVDQFVANLGLTLFVTRDALYPSWACQKLTA